MHGYFGATERTGPAIAGVCDTTKAREVFRVEALLAKDDYWHDHLFDVEENGRHQVAAK